MAPSSRRWLKETRIVGAAHVGVTEVPTNCSSDGAPPAFRRCLIALSPFTIRIAPASGPRIAFRCGAVGLVVGINPRRGPWVSSLSLQLARPEKQHREWSGFRRGASRGERSRSRIADSGVQLRKVRDTTIWKSSKSLVIQRLHGGHRIHDSDAGAGEYVIEVTW